MALKSILEIYKPYFHFKKSNRWQWVLVGLIIIGNISQACFFVMINYCFNNIFTVLAAPVLSYSLLYRAIGEYLLAVAVYTGTAFLNLLATEKLIYHLNLVIIKDYVSKWMDSKTYFGANFLPKRKVLNPGMVLSHDIMEANQYAIRLGDNFINTFFLFLAGLYGLWEFSVPLIFNVGSMVVVIPWFIVIGALAYSILYNVVVNLIGHRLHSLTEKHYKNMNELEANIHHVEKNAESIELLQARMHEKGNFMQLLKKGRKHQVFLAPLQAGLGACTAMNEQLHYFVGCLLGLPQLIAKAITVDNLLTISDYFSRVVNFFSWQHDNYEDWTHLSVLTGRLSQLQKEINEWVQIRDKSCLEYEVGGQLALHHLTIQKPDQSVILQQEHFTFKNGKVTLIQGPSGSGKSTIARTLSKLWPYATGKLSMPAEIHIMPQKVYFPMRSSLYQAILYPHHADITVGTKGEIVALMREFQMDEGIIQAMDKERDWSKILSGGEQQRIAMIQAVRHQPRYLLMDEPFSALDRKLAAHCEKLFREKLPETTMLVIDHRSEEKKDQPSENTFFQYRVAVENKRLVEVTPQESFHSPMRATC